MSGFWIAVAFVVPTAISLLVAVPFWFTRNAIIGNIIAMGIVFAAVLALIAREFIALERIRQRCVQTGVGCGDVELASAFNRYAGYGLIGLVDIGAVFAASLAVEHWRERRRYSKEWR